MAQFIDEKQGAPIAFYASVTRVLSYDQLEGHT